MNSIKKMVVTWKANYQLEAKNEKGLSVKFDAPIDHGGEETALSPMENVLASLAACSSFHVLRILKKMRQEKPVILWKQQLKEEKTPLQESLQKFTLSI